MAAKIPTQNNIAEIIKTLNDNLGAFEDLMQIVSGILDDKSVFLRKDFREKIREIEKNVDKVLGKHGLITDIIHAIRRLPKEGRLQSAINRIDIISKSLVKSLSSFVESANKIFSTLNGLKFLSLLAARIKFYIATKFIMRMLHWFLNPFRFAKFQLYNASAQTINMALAQMILGVRILRGVAHALLTIDVNWYKMILIRARIKKLKKLIRELIGVGIGKTKTDVGLFWYVLPMTVLGPIVTPALINLTIATFFLGKFVQQLKKIKFGVFTGAWFMRRRIKMLKWIIRDLIRLFRRLGRPGNAVYFLRASLSLMLMMMALRKLTLTLIIVIISIPVYVAFIILAPIILIAFFMIFLIIRGIVWVAKMAMGKTAYMGLLKLFFLVTALTGIAVLLIVFGLLSLILVGMIPKIILTILGLIVIVLAIAALGLILALISPAIIAMTAGVVMVFVIVTSLFLISLMLMLITLIRLDKEKIIAKVHEIMSVAKEIVAALFDDEDEKGNRKESPSWAMRILRGLFQGLGMFLEMLFAAATLAMAVIAVFAILLIAGILRLLQMIELDPERIRNNVKAVLDTAKLIISSIFDNDEKKEENKSWRPWFVQFIDYVFSRLGTIIDALLASVILIFTVISVGMILLIAKILKHIQNVELDKDKITDNVTMIIGLARDIIDTIFNPKDEKEDNEPKSWFRQFLDYCFERFAAILDAILAVAFLTLTLISIGIVILIAKQLKFIQETDIDAETAREKAINIIGAAMDVMNAIFDYKKNLHTPKAETWFGQLIEWAFPELSAIIKALTSILFLSIALIGIGVVKKIGEHLMLIQNITLDSGKIRTNVDLIMGEVTKVMDQISKMKLERGDVRKAKRIKKAAQAFEAFGTIAETLKSLSEIDVATIALSNEKIKEVLKVFNVFEELGWDKKKVKDIKKVAKQASQVAEYIADAANNIISIGDNKQATQLYFNMMMLIQATEAIQKANFGAMAIQRLQIMGMAYQSLSPWLNVTQGQVDINRQLIDQSIQFFEKINNTDLEKLKTTEKLFQNMAKLSSTINGNFQGLADALNDRIAPVIEELNKKIDDVKALQAEAIDDNNANNGNEKGTEDTAKKKVASSKPGALIQTVSDKYGTETVDTANLKAYYRATKNGKDIGAILNVLTGNGGTGGVLTRSR